MYYVYVCAYVYIHIYILSFSNLKERLIDYVLPIEGADHVFYCLVKCS